jgi:HK97 gp10 family phage protein
MATQNPSVEEFKRKLAQIAPSIQVETMAEVRKQADRLVAVMKSVVPVRTGKLRDSIRTAPGSNKVQMRVMAGGPTTTVEVRKGSGVPYDYARAVEWGTSQEHAQPFFWPSYRLMKRPIRSALSRASRKGIEKILKLTNVSP